VLGGVGDYFDVCDTVIQMKNYQPFDVTTRAKQIAVQSPAKRLPEKGSFSFNRKDRIPLADSVKPFNRYDKLSVYAREVYRINFGEEVIDLTDLEQLKELSQTKALAYALVYAKKYMDGRRTIRQVIDQVIRDIADNGIDLLSDRVSGHFAGFRGLELAFVLNRLRSFDVA